MRILILHNEYGAISGEEVMLNHASELLASRGHPIHRYTRHSQEIEGRIFGKASALFSGVYSASARDDIGAVIKRFKPDVAIVKNLYPLISPAVLPVLGRAGVPAVMFVSNYRLICPNGLHFTRGQVCERCTGGKEYHCVLRNCEGSLAKSFGYALRSWVAREAGWYKKYVAQFACASQFLKAKLMGAGYEESRLQVIPNLVPDPLRGREVIPASVGDYVAYAGRISKEKGIFTLLRAAALCPEIPFKIAGRVNLPENLLEISPKNVTFVGFLEGEDLVNFVLRSRVVLSTSECYETFGMTVAEAMSCARPVIASRIGVFPEFVEDGTAGLLFEPGNAEDLTEKVRFLWTRPELCNRLGAEGRTKALRDYAEDKYYASVHAMLRAAVEVPAAGTRATGRGI